MSIFLFWSIARPPAGIERFSSPTFLSQKLFFWQKNVLALYDKIYLETLSLPVKVIYADTSDVARGAHVENTGMIFYQSWSSSERFQKFNLEGAQGGPPCFGDFCLASFEHESFLV